jgi:hypothetical protein
MPAIAKPPPEEFLVAARERAIFDAVWFAENILNLKQLPGEKSLSQDPNDSWELDSWTKDLLNAVCDVVRKEYGRPTVLNHEGVNQITVRSMHGPGKTFGLACLMHWFGFCFKGKIPCTAPKLAQLKSRLWPEFRKVRNRAIPGYKSLMKTQGSSIFWVGEDGQWDPDHWAFMETASQPENLAGLHDKFMMICVDEASGVDENLWPVIEGAISTGKIVILVIISNPTKTTGTFADSHLKPIVAKDWFQMHIRLEDTKRVSRGWVKRMENKYGKGSPVVKVRCFGDFAEDDENQLISMGWLEAARNREFKPDGSIPTRRLSVDVADGGIDFSVITLASEYESFTYLRKQKQYSFPSGRSVTMLCDEVEKWWKEFKLDARNDDDIVVDGLGVGAGVVSELIDRGLPVIRYVGGERSDNTKMYRNRRAQSYMVARDRFRIGTMIISENFVEPDEWDDFYGQMCSVKKKISGTERVEDLITKKEMKEAGITSPDRADSVVMQFATQIPVLVKPSTDDFVVIPTVETAHYDGSIA